MSFKQADSGLILPAAEWPVYTPSDPIIGKDFRLPVNWPSTDPPVNLLDARGDQLVVRHDEFDGGYDFDEERYCKLIDAMGGTSLPQLVVLSPRFRSFASTLQDPDGTCHQSVIILRKHMSVERTNRILIHETKHHVDDTKGLITYNPSPRDQNIHYKVLGLTINIIESLQTEFDDEERRERLVALCSKMRGLMRFAPMKRASSVRQEGRAYHSEAKYLDEFSGIISRT